MCLFKPVHTTYALLAFASGIFCIQLDAFSLNLALLQIGEDLDASPRSLKWAISGYLLSVGIFMLAAGRLSDRFGHQRMLMFGLSLFGIASLICGLATSFPLFLAARLLQGLGAACIMPAGLALLSNLYPVDQRGGAIGLAIGFGGIATALGPFVGGGLTEWYSWRLIFLLNIPVITLALWWGYRVRVLCIERSSGQRVDSLGLVLVSAMLALLSFLLDELISHPLDKHVSLLMAGALCMLTYVFILRERKMPVPFIDISLFRNKQYVVLSVAGAVVNTATVAHLFILPLSLQTIWGLTPFDAGLLFLMPTFLLAFGGPVAGRISVSSAVSTMARCLAVVALCFIAATWVKTLWAYVLIMTLCGAALGVANALTLVATQAVVNPEIAGVASGVTKTLITIAAGLGVLFSGFAYQRALMVLGLCCLVTFVMLMIWIRRNQVLPREGHRRG